MKVKGEICLCDVVNAAYGESKHFFKLTTFEPYKAGYFVKITSDEEFDTSDLAKAAAEKFADEHGFKIEWEGEICGFITL